MPLRFSSFIVTSINVTRSAGYFFRLFTLIFFLVGGLNTAYGVTYTIKGVKAYAICAEPAFIDSPAHRPLFNATGMRRIGDCLANGIHSFILGE